MAGYQSFWCPSGGDWYTCRTGTFFAGCCAVDPCNDTCPEQHLYPVFFNPALYGEFPDMSCEAAGQFYTCTREAQEEAFFGCCKSDPCRNNATCPDGNLLPAFMERPDQIDLFGDPSVNNMGAPPVTTSSVVIATGPAMASTHIDSGNGSGYSRDVILPSISVAIIVALCAFVALWLGLRKIFSRGRHAYVSVEPMNSSNDPVGSPKPDTHAAITETSAVPVKDDFQRLGLKSALALLASVLAVLAMCAFLMFLWFGDSKNGTWKHIMVQGWATRSVAVTALILRTCVDLQAAVACAILAALLLESRTGIHLYQAASMSSMRTGNTSPWTFANCVLEEIWRSTAQSRRNHHVYAMAVFLLLTTSVLQFSSTLLLSDLQIGQLVGAVTPSEVLPGLSYSIKSPKKIARDSAWTTNPPNYATFGEYHEPPPETADGIADTGMLLRAFLPYPAAGLRQTLASYRGNALTIDARVACQKPLITEFKGKGLNAQITGIVSPTKNVTMMQPIKPTPFDCTVAGVNQTTICQLGRSDDDFIGSLKSQFEKSTAYGTAFLIINGSSITSTGSEWQTLSFPKTNVTTMMNMPKKKNEASIALTLCFAPWDAAILDVTLDSKVNGTEPLIRYYKEFEPWEVLNYLIPVAQNGTRQVMEMQKPHSFLGDLPPPYRRPVVQSDIGGSSASSVGTIFPLPGNWSVFLTGTPLVTHLRSLESPSTNITSADPVLASIFNVAMRDGYGVAWALSSLITVLSMTNYYGQQVAFDRVDTVVVSFFENVLYPRSSTGLTILFWTLVAHFALLALLVVLFVTKTKFTLVGNAWSAFAQVAESRVVKEYMAGASLTDDSTLLDQLRKSGKGDLRARLVGRGDGAEVTVE